MRFLSVSFFYFFLFSQDLIDIGGGYDSTDSFVDDSELVRERERNVCVNFVKLCFV